MKTIEIDPATREALVGTIRENFEMYNEVYVTPAELCKQICMFTPKWLERHGHRLPREHFEVKDEDGVITRTRWGYPLHQIQRMIAEGKLRDM